MICGTVSGASVVLSDVSDVRWKMNASVTSVPDEFERVILVSFTAIYQMQYNCNMSL